MTDKLFDDSANETDVREDLIVDFLKELGYQRGTENNIAREVHLSYSYVQLGREKKSDPVIAGRPDYLLSVAGAGRWVLEAKGPASKLDASEIGQALSYAKHPEVSATFAVLTNGNVLKVFAAHQIATDKPIFERKVVSAAELAFAVTGYLSPQAIRKQCKLPIVAQGEPLAHGFTNAVEIRGGHTSFEENSYSVGSDVPPELAKQLSEDLERRTSFLNGHRSHILGGLIKRDQNSRIIARLEIATDHKELERFVEQKRLMDIEYICLDNRISEHPDAPSVFDVVGDCQINSGEPVYDTITRRTTLANFPLTATFMGTATGYLTETQFQGSFTQETLFEIETANGSIRYSTWSSGQFTVRLN